MPIIQTEIRVADILAEYQAHNDAFIFICYAIAHKLNEKYDLVHGEHNYCYPYHWISAHAGMHALSNQINSQLHEFVRKLNPNIFIPGLTFGDFFLMYGGATAHINNNGVLKEIELAASNHKFREQFLEFIVEMDPEAVFSVNLQF